jgi:hypothetical protein
MKTKVYIIVRPLICCDICVKTGSLISKYFFFHKNFITAILLLGELFIIKLGDPSAVQ